MSFGIDTYKKNSADKTLEFVLEVLDYLTTKYNE